MDNLAGDGHLGRVFSHKYIFGVAILSLTFMVTGTNIYASTAPAKVIDAEEHHNLLMKMLVGVEDELLLEDTDYDPGATKDVGYLDGYAINIRDFYAGQEIDEDVPTESDMYGPVNVEYSEVAINAVTNLPTLSDSYTEILPTRTRIIEYEVKSGDNAGSIARKFGLTTKTILDCNSLSSWSVLGIGRKLRIPPVDGIIYSIKSGDTLNKLAIKYDSEAETISEINGITPDDLSVGTEVVLPGGRMPAPPPPPKVVAKYTASQTSYSTPSPDLLANTKLLWPTSARRISQYYSRSHTGLDIAGPMRTPLYASESGTIIYSGWNSGGYGNMVLIDHGGGLYTRYAHATQLLVKKGDQVSRGDTIALMGSTGRSTGPHIHFEVAVGSIYNRVNPLTYIK